MIKKDLLRKMYTIIPTTVSTVINKFTFWANKVQCGKKFTSRGLIRVHRVFSFPFIGEKNIVLGNNVRINSSIASDPVSFANKTIFYINRRGKIRIQDRSGISNSIIVAHDAMVCVGEDVMLGAGVKIYTTDFHSTDFQDRKNHVNTKCGDVYIDDGAFIGADTIILKGVHIGKRSVIAANSVVTKNVPNDEIWGGNPAKFIRKLETKS